jgi:hypothetical protein
MRLVKKAIKKSCKETVVGVAQLVELRIVIPAVVGSNPIVHPTFSVLRAYPGELKTKVLREWWNW